MSVHQLVAHFLQQHGYTETLAQFHKEHGRPIVVGSLDESLEDIVQDRTAYKTLEQKAEELKLSEWTEHPLGKQLCQWRSGTPSKAHTVAGIDGLVISGASDRQYSFLSTNKMAVAVVDVATGTLKKTLPQVLGRVVVKNVVCLPGRRVVFVGMDGQFHLFQYDDDVSLTALGAVQGHRRLVVDARSVHVDGRDFVVSLGWDSTVKVLEATAAALVPVAEFSFVGQGTCLDVAAHRGDVVVVLGRRDSTLLEVLRVDVEAGAVEPQYKISLNDAEFSQYGFSPMAVAIDSAALPVPVVVVGTSHEPYMRLIVVSLAEYGSAAQGVARGQILKNYPTESPQDKYSQAALVAAAGDVWVAGDDGVLRGIDLASGSTVVALAGHSGIIKHLQSVSEGTLTCGTDNQVHIWR